MLNFFFISCLAEDLYLKYLFVTIRLRRKAIHPDRARRIVLCHIKLRRH